MPLTDSAVRSAKPSEKARRMYDEKGLYLEISKAGSKLWRLKYRFAGREKRISFGAYPEVSLKEARDRRDSARQLLRDGVDPSEARKAAVAVLDRPDFRSVAVEWFGKHEPNWAESHSSKVWGRIEKDLVPWLGTRPIDEITPPELLQVLRRVEDRGALDTAHRLHQYCGAIFRYAIATGRVQRDPAADLRGALPPKRSKHYATITDPKEVGVLLRAIDSYQGSFVVRCALRLAPLTFVRPGELRNAEWSEMNFEEAEWRIPAVKMKMNAPHIVPLSTQSIEVLREIQPLSGHGRYVFPGAVSRLRPISENTVNTALRRLGYTKEQMTGHGFRAMASTLLNEEGLWSRDAIERQLAHSERDRVRAAYNYAEYMPERKRMMQAWADRLAALRGSQE